jgi:SNF2 family DNA or RNA helicase
LKNTVHLLRAELSQVSGKALRRNPLTTMAKAHQIGALEFALNRGKSAAFLDTGLGKSFIELEFARQCAEETGKPSLILTPLAVAGQMVREGQKFGIDARQIREQSDVGAA